VAAVTIFREFSDDWDRRPAGPGTPELIFIAVRG